ncbi:histidine phosphatase family protein [Micromonospora pallida]|uniref:histidine phosphatase family protein n=1 Tax=Micromonospora pallida TaxID=145854 RepID=UPI000AFD0826|nr:histidine phosphatase family protein [Micromonospora pallida]
MARTLLYLVRHGEQDPALGHSTDGGLSERGRRQADRLGRRLADDVLDHAPQPDEDAVGLRAAVDHFGADSAEDRYELVVTHNFVIGWFVRHVLDAPTWRWMSLNQENCGLTIVRWDTNRPPALVCFNDIGHL